mmetsp:Transcript_8648/g.32377  ORF Transcript_8648/g.32377 Transcript_8648/m.32377 type:complete len:241 (-) Transcript_8648:1628-2350(-)
MASTRTNVSSVAASVSSSFSRVNDPSIAAAVAASAPGKLPNAFKLPTNRLNSSALIVPLSSRSSIVSKSSDVAAMPSSCPSVLHTDPITVRSSSRVTTPSPFRSNMANSEESAVSPESALGTPPAPARPVSEYIPNLCSAAALAVFTSVASASAAPGSVLNPPLYPACPAAPASAARCMLHVRTCSSTLLSTGFDCLAPAPAPTPRDASSESFPSPRDAVSSRVPSSHVDGSFNVLCRLR